jgi:hypothetical protein
MASGKLSDCAAQCLPPTPRRPRAPTGPISFTTSGCGRRCAGITAFYKPPPGAEEKAARERFQLGQDRGDPEARARPGHHLDRRAAPARLRFDQGGRDRLGAQLAQPGSEIYETIRNLGQLVRQAGRASRLVARLKRDLQPVETNGSPRPRVYFEEWPEPLITGIGWVSELIERAGGSDIFAEIAAGKERRGAGRHARGGAGAGAGDDLRFLVRRPVQMGDITSRPAGTRCPPSSAGRLYEIPRTIFCNRGRG